MDVDQARPDSPHRKMLDFLAESDRVLSALDQAPDDFLLAADDMIPQPLSVWREALGHPSAEGHGFCKTCGAGGPCILMTFFDAVMHTTVRELGRQGLLVPEEREGDSHE